jgi:hypothetical protein
MIMGRNLPDSFLGSILWCMGYQRPQGQTHLPLDNFDTKNGTQSPVFYLLINVTAGKNIDARSQCVLEYYLAHFNRNL